MKRREQPSGSRAPSAGALLTSPGCHAAVGECRVGVGCGASRKREPLPRIRVPSSRSPSSPRGLRAPDQGFHLQPFPRKKDRKSSV